MTTHPAELITATDKVVTLRLSGDHGVSEAALKSEWLSETDGGLLLRFPIPKRFSEVTHEPVEWGLPLEVKFELSREAVDAVVAAKTELSKP